MLFLLACTMGPAPETLIDELRTVVVLADLPEAGAGESVALEAIVVDPEDEGFEALTWTCTFAGEGCLESLGEETWSGLSLVEDAPASIATDYTVSPALSKFLTEEPQPLVSHWTLACAPGACPLFDAVRADEAEAVREDLSDPLSWMADLSFEGVSLSLRTLQLSSRSAEERLSNPTVDCTPEGGELTVEAGEELPFDCAVSGDFDQEAGLWGYTTAGGWGQNVTPLSVTEVSQAYSYFAPDEAGEVPVWVVIIDGRGGVGLWSETITVL